MGKSTLVDFSKASTETFNLFNDLSDLDYIFLRLQPQARQAIKHLVADYRYDYIETGSLLSIRKNVKNIVIPSEETKLKMNPMDYEEFRWAMGDTVTVPLLQKAFADELPLKEAHRAYEGFPALHAYRRNAPGCE